MTSSPFAPLPELPLGGGGSWVKMTDITHLAVVMADSTSENWYQLVSGAPGRHGVGNRAPFDINGAQNQKKHENYGFSPPVAATGLRSLGMNSFGGY